MTRYLIILLLAATSALAADNEIEMEALRHHFTETLAHDRTNTLKTLTDKISNGTPVEKDAALCVFEDEEITDLIPIVIQAISDTTTAPQYDDTGWGFIGHHAAWALAHVATKLDGISIEERGRDEYTFFSDMGDGAEKLLANGRLAAVTARWEKWWDQRGKK